MRAKIIVIAICVVVVASPGVAANPPSAPASDEAVGILGGKTYTYGTLASPTCITDTRSDACHSRNFISAPGGNFSNPRQARPRSPSDSLIVTAETFTPGDRPRPATRRPLQPLRSMPPARTRFPQNRPLPKKRAPPLPRGRAQLQKTPRSGPSESMFRTRNLSSSAGACWRRGGLSGKWSRMQPKA